jgi:putative adenylate-forming enzyme
VLEALDVLRWFLIARGLDRETSRANLERRQRRLIARLMRRILPRSPFYAPYADGAFEALPIIDKARWMHAFNEINTAGIRLDHALRVAAEAEQSRDFKPTIGAVTVGLSTGASGQRGVFLVSAAERRRWAGVMLAKLLPKRSFARRRVAFLLRANSRLYETAGSFGPIIFRFFDLLAPWREVGDAVAAFAPHVLIAPAGALRRLADDQRALTPEIVISVAETLYDDDRRAIEAAFHQAPGQVYQATEGLIATSCEHGALHLNEAFVHIEPDWLDRAQRRFAPIVTDLTRATQPVVRYRLDDILVQAERPCRCGRAALALEAVEGRCDDICAFTTADGSPCPVFPDFLARAVLGAAPEIMDFTLTQTAPGAFDIALRGGEGCEAPVRAALGDLARRLGATAPALVFSAYVVPAGKRRRIRRLKAAAALT